MFFDAVQQSQQNESYGEDKIRGKDDVGNGSTELKDIHLLLKLKAL